jgi:hypothetical protein
MDIIIGPVLKRPEGYGFDVWTGAKGVTRGYPYRRIEDAYYAWKAEIRASAKSRTPAPIVCQTLDEFIVKSAAGLALVWLSSGAAPFSVSDIPGSL